MTTAHKPNIANQKTRLADLEFGQTYLMLTSDQLEQIGAGFYAVLEPIDDGQYAIIQQGSARLGLDAFIVECTFKADTTIVLSNPRAPENIRSITFEIDAYGNGHPVTKHSLQ